MSEDKISRIIKIIVVEPPLFVELPTMVSSTEKAPRIQALARASEIIDVITSRGEEGVGLSEISREAGLNKTTVFNLIASLVTLGFVQQDSSSKRYFLGVRNMELGRIVQSRLQISNVARPILVNLCKKTNETVSLALPDQLDMLVIDSFQGSQLLQATAYTGSRSMYHCTGLGKSVIARWDDEQRQRVYRLRGLPKLTQHTIVDTGTLEAELRKVLKQGYALDSEENELGISCIATAVLNESGEAIAAISVSGPTTRMSSDIKPMATDLMASAEEIAAIME